MTTIIKRDGKTQAYDAKKISTAIMKAVNETRSDLTIKELQDLVSAITAKLDTLYPEGTATVEQVQDQVESELIFSNHATIAKGYILYRSKRNNLRQSKSSLMKTMQDLTFKASRDADAKRENANINTDSAMGTMLKYGSETAKEFNQLFCMSPAHARAHSEGDIHVHDLDFMTLTETCCQIDLLKLFKGGFSTGHGFLREPSRIQTAASLACIAIQSNQNDQHGGQSIPCFDYYMAPYVTKSFIRNITHQLRLISRFTLCDITRLENLKLALETLSQHASLLDNKDETVRLISEHTTLTPHDATEVFCSAVEDTQEDTHQAMEAFVHNLNSMHSRAGAQVPFSSVNFGTDISAEGRMVTSALLDSIYAGLGHGETAIFPISIFKVKDGVNANPGDPNYDLFQQAIKTTAKRLFPNFSFLDAAFNAKYYIPGKPETEVAYMGCRTRVIGNTYSPIEEVVTGRGNLSFTSINLPRIAILANKDIDKFLSLLKERVLSVKEQLLERFDWQCRKQVKNYPFLMGQGVWRGSEKLKSEDSVAEILKQGTLTIGFIGLAETLVALVGKHHGESSTAQTLGCLIVSTMRKMTDTFSEETGLNWSIIGTPAEGLSGRFVRIDRQRFGIIPGVTDKDWYTNSFHVPVEYKISIAEKIRIEAPYHTLTNGGHISYIELDGDATNNLGAIEKIIKCMQKAGIGYGAINHPVDRDPVCGYTGIINDECPSCHRIETPDQPMERIRRITGYLVGTLDRFNDAKRAEEAHRVKHTMSEEE